MKTLKAFLLAVLFACSAPLMAAETLTIAAAADLKFAMEEIVAAFKQAHPGDKVDTIFGSSGKFHTQIQQGAPYDLFFSADIKYPQMLAKEGFAASEVRPYAFGRIVLWSPSRDASKMTLADLTDPSIRKIAIANPKHAPYGKRAEEALRSAGLWDKVQDRLVLGENIAQTAQYVQTGNADIGIVALSLALNKELASKGGYALIDDKLHQPLEQGFIVTRRAADNALAKQFADYMGSAEARRIMVHYGFVLPGESLEK
ncbi:molybdate ABC transporter substrate-binding protein [Caldichromatium japonicum]|uniref:Molybdate ABC transporter substrate-binding protein n=1 Tax=Caldichromatium japonicum TaxID=2699430 RepID=A0A6G7VEX2_9GAMM|nr:molybdate ABC transporter substrate-binding protein [Caldichromatium japonicum]